MLSVPKCGKAGTYDRFIFTMLKICQTVFQSGYTILHTYQQCMRVLVPPHPH